MAHALAPVAARDCHAPLAKTMEVGPCGSYGQLKPPSLQYHFERHCERLGRPIRMIASRSAAISIYPCRTDHESRHTPDPMTHAQAPVVARDCHGPPALGLVWTAAATSPAVGFPPCHSLTWRRRQAPRSGRDRCDRLGGPTHMTASRSAAISDLPLQWHSQTLLSAR
jgi:hypothetical protein